MSALAECFTPGREVATFATPAEAREVVSDLLADRDRRESMAAAARARLLTEHTWEKRLPEMLNRAGWPGA
ncbi:MAG: glycosyltransferase family 1 protein [Planctomycetes bacterium]|nr:glycosyltransferase family 1 protein [Planctomycetota bacterium]